MVTVRSMQADDAEAVSQMEKQIFSMPWSRQGFLDSLARSDTMFLIAEEGTKILGYIGMYISVDEGEIMNVAVESSARCRGIGQMLIESVKEAARSRSVTKIALEVRVSNGGAIRLYEKNGFQICGVRKGFYELPREDAYIMIYGQ